MCRAVIVDRIYEDAERVVPLDPGLTVHEVVARLADAHPDLFTAQDPGHPLPAFPDGLRFRLPTLAVGTGPDGNPDYILQRTWHTRTLQPGETIAFVVVPRGGGGGSNAGKQIAGVIAMIALTIAAPYIAVGLGGAAFGAISGGMATLTFAGRLAAMGIVAGGAALMNALQPKADGPAVQEQKVYSAAAANNALQPGAIVPVPYGLNRYAPPFATRPYVEYEGNEQFLYQVLCPGKGHHAIKRVLYGDTTVWTAEDGYSDAIEGLELEFCDPGQGVTLFPAGVVIASEVQGQEIPNPAQWQGTFEPTWLGGFTVNAAGEANRIDRIAIDFMMPEGIYAQGSGGISAFGADLMAQYREIDDSGDPVGSWTTFVGDGTGENGGKRYWGATKEPQRFTEKVDVPKGRYEVRVAATYPFQPADSDAKNRTLWGGLKGYLADFTTPPGVTQIAVKIQAGHDLSELSANQFFVESVRKLPVWDPDTETWSEPVETRSIAWAVADWLMNTDYGGGIAEGDIDLAWLAAYDSFWEDRGDTFNGIFDREWMLLDGANAILRCGRSQVVRIGDKVGFTRYEAKDVKRAVFTPRTIVKGSFKRRWIFSDDTLPDSKYCKFLDAETWQYDEIKVEAPGYGSSRPVEETLFGFVDRDHVWREGVTDCAINAYRDREFVSFTTEWDGKRLVRGDPVLAVHPLMANAFARIDAVDSNVISLDRDIAQALTQQWVDDAADWTALNAGAPGSVADLPGSFVEDSAFGRLVAVRSGTSTNPIRSKRTIDAPRDDTIIELQVRWRVVGDGEGRIVARCVSLDEDHAQLSVVGEATDLVSGAGQRLTRFFFANPATAAGIGGVTAWAAAAKLLRFGVNVNAGEGGAEVRIAQIRIREVHGLQDRIYVRGKRGREWGFCDVASIPDDRTIVLDATHLAEVVAADGSIASILPGPRAEKAHLALFQDDARPFDGLVVSMRPTGPNRVDVLLVRDDPRPYEADETGSAPPYLPPRKPPTPPDRPIVTGLSARLENGDFDVQLIAGWLPAAGARAYVARVSYDEGDTWEQVWRGRDPSFTVVSLRQAQRVSVRAIGKLPGPWVYVDIADLAVPPPSTPPPGWIDIPNLETDFQVYLHMIQAKHEAFVADRLDNVNHEFERIAASVADVMGRLKVGEDDVYSAIGAQAENASAQFLRIDRALAEKDRALAETITFLEAALQGIDDQFDLSASALQALTVLVEANEDGILVLSQLLTALEAEFNSLDGDLSALTTATQLLESRIQVTEGLIDVLSQFTVALESRLNSTDLDVAAAALALSQLTTRVTAAEGQITVLAQQATTLLAIVNHPTSGNAALALAAQQLLSRVTIAEGEITSLSQFRTSIQSRVSDLEGQYTGLADGYDELTTRVSDVEGKVTIEAIRDSLLQAQYLLFDPLTVWRNRAQLLAKGALTIGATLGTGPGQALRISNTGNAGRVYWTLPIPERFAGGGNRYVKVVGRWIGTAVPFLGRLYYRTAGHGYVGTHYKDAPNPWGSGNVQTGGLVELTFDMHNLTAGGSDWQNSEILGLMFQPSTSASSVFDMIWIGWGSQLPTNMAAVIESQTARVQHTDNGLSSLAEALTGVVVRGPDGEFGQAGLRFQVEQNPASLPGGVLARAAFSVMAATDNNPREAAIFLNALAQGQGGGSEIEMVAERIAFVTNAGGNKTKPFYYQGGTFRISGDFVADVLRSNDNKMQIDLNAGRLLISD